MRREHWVSEVGLLMALAGSTIGIGALWRVHGFVISGGATFLWSYMLFALLFAFPIFISESLLGRYTGSASIQAFNKITKSWVRIGGICHSFSAILIIVLFLSLSGYFLTYLFYEVLGWVPYRTSSYAIDLWDHISHSYLCLFSSWVVLSAVSAVIFYGVKAGIERCMNILMPIFFLLLLTVALFSFATPHIGEVFNLLFMPKYSQFTLYTFYTALEMAFFTVSAGCGVLISYSSYMDKRSHLLRVGLVSTIISFVVPVISAIIVFSAALNGGISISSNEGGNIVFTILPLLFREFYFPHLFTIIFLLLFVFAAASSVLAVMEGLVANTMECFLWSRQKSLFAVSMLLAILTIPFVLSYIIAWNGVAVANTILTPVMLVTILLTAVVVSWMISSENLSKEFSAGSAKYSFLYGTWLCIVRYFIPIGISILLVLSLV